MLKRTLAVLVAIVLAAPLIAAELGDDGLHKQPWMRDTFKDMREDLDEANAEGKRLMIILEQRGCTYCKKMHEEVFSQSEVSDFIVENFFVVQLNMHGDVDVTDFDGETLSEADMARKWGLLFTPMILFLPENVPAGMAADAAAVATMPGAFSASTTFDLLVWVRDKVYETGEDFQRYHARKIKERAG